MKEIERLIESCKNYRNVFGPQAMNGPQMVTDREFRHDILNVEAMLKRAKVFEGWALKSALNQPVVDEKNLKSVAVAFTPKQFSDEQIKINIIVIPEEENAE